MVKKRFSAENKKNLSKIIGNRIDDLYDILTDNRFALQCVGLYSNCTKENSGILSEVNLRL